MWLVGQSICTSSDYLCLRKVLVVVFVLGTVFETNICVCEKMMEVVWPMCTWNNYLCLCFRKVFLRGTVFETGICVCEKLPVCTWGKHLMFVFVFVFKTANFICNFVEAGICFLRSWWSIWTWDQHLHLYLWDTYLCLYLYFHLWQVIVFVRS